MPDDDAFSSICQPHVGRSGLVRFVVHGSVDSIPYGAAAAGMFPLQFFLSPSVQFSGEWEKIIKI